MKTESSLRNVYVLNINNAINKVQKHKNCITILSSQNCICCRAYNEVHGHVADSNQDKDFSVSVPLLCRAGFSTYS
jgi:hypothetical protein